MGIFKDPENVRKIERDEFATLLDTTPNAETSTYALLGYGVNEYGIEYNPQVDSSKYIIHRNASHDHSSNEKQGSISQECFKGEPCFEFIRKAKGKLNYKTHILDIDTWDGTTAGVYPAELSDGLIVVTKYMSDKAIIEYDLYYEGDPVEGTVTITNGVPTFTPKAD